MALKFFYGSQNFGYRLFQNDEQENRKESSVAILTFNLALASLNLATSKRGARK